MRRSAFYAAVAALFLSASVQAEIRVHTSLGKLSATLIDLNPGDGIAPSITFDPVPLDLNWIPHSAEVSMYTQMRGGGSDYLAGPMPGLSLTKDVPGRASLAGSVTDRADPLQTTIDLSLQLSSDSREYQFAFARAKTDRFTYVLTPYTSVVFVLPGQSSVRLDNGMYELVVGESVFSASLWRPDGVTMDSGSQSFSDEPRSGRTPQPYALDQDFSLTVLLSNPSDQRWHGEGTFSSFVSGGSNPLPVPEPGSTAMLIAGLTLLGWRSRRRQ